MAPAVSPLTMYQSMYDRTIAMKVPKTLINCPYIPDPAVRVVDMATMIAPKVCAT